MVPKVVLITGANTGIGFETARALSISGHAYDIIVSGRSWTKVHDAVSRLENEFSETKSKFIPLELDVESDDAIKRACEEVESHFGRLDVLVNNAGAQFEQAILRGETSERDAWNQTWNVNVSSAQVVTSAFVPLLLESSDPRILFVTSGTANLAAAEKNEGFVNQSPPKGWPKTGLALPAYRSAKTGLNMMMRDWHRLLKEDGVKVWAISPGLLATGLGGNPDLLKKLGAGDPSLGGSFICCVIEGERDADVGKVVNRDGVQPW